MQVSVIDSAPIAGRQIAPAVAAGDAESRTPHSDTTVQAFVAELRARLAVARAAAEAAEHWRS
jgi:hypothetical protein